MFYSKALISKGGPLQVGATCRMCVLGWRVCVQALPCTPALSLCSAVSGRGTGTSRLTTWSGVHCVSAGALQRGHTSTAHRPVIRRTLCQVTPCHCLPAARMDSILLRQAYPSARAAGNINLRRSQLHPAPRGTRRPRALTNPFSVLTRPLG